MRIIVASRDSSVRSALCMLFRAQDDLNVVDEASDALDLRSVLSTSTSSPDLVIVDLDGFGTPLEDILVAVRRLDKPPRIFGISVRSGDRSAVLDSGADDFVYKGDPPDRLLAAIRSAKRRDEVQRRDSTNSQNE